MKIQVIAVKTCTVTKSREDLILSLKIGLLNSMNFLPLTLNYRLSSGFNELLVSFFLPLLYFFCEEWNRVVEICLFEGESKMSFISIGKYFASEGNGTTWNLLFWEFSASQNSKFPPTTVELKGMEHNSMLQFIVQFTFGKYLNLKRCIQ